MVPSLGRSDLSVSAASVPWLDRSDLSVLLEVKGRKVFRVRRGRREQLEQRARKAIQEVSVHKGFKV